MSKIEIRQVQTKTDLKAFVDFPFQLFKGNLYWVPPIKSDEIKTLQNDINPVFEFCEAEYWIAYKDGKITGRIAGIINNHEVVRWNKRVARFGWFDFIDDPEVSGRLIETVINWAEEKGMTSLQGPMGFCNMDSEGMLMEGFDEMSSLSAIYNYPYYVSHMERLGFSKAADLVQYEISIPKEIPDKVERLTKLVLAKYGLHMLKPKSVAELRPYIEKMFLLYNNSFHDLYGFTALSEKQIEYYAKKYLRLIRPDLISLVIDNEDDVVGFGVCMPNLSRALQRTHGKLYPFGFLHLLKAIRQNDQVQLYLIGVRPDYQGKGLLALIYQELQNTFVKNGFTVARTQPQLEDNLKAVSIWKNYENRIYIRRRVWSLDLLVNNE
jgi:GNAT superfamily N-acetyltransferase